MKYININIASSLIVCCLFLTTKITLCQYQWLNTFKNKNSNTYIGNWLQLTDEQKMRLGSVVGTLKNIDSAEKSINNPKEFDYAFPREEYEHYMKLIQEIDPKAYKRLRICESELGVPCIDKAVDIEPLVELGNEETQGHPIIVIKSMKEHDEQYQKDILKIYLAWYNNLESIHPITQEERNTILDLIKTVAPELYVTMIQSDPEGRNHIFRNYGIGFTSSVSYNDGLPIINVDQYSLTKYPRKFLEASIAHELGHYVSGHFFDQTEATHKFLLPETEHSQNDKPDAKEIFNLAKNRVEEFEADKSEVLDFDIDIDTSIASAQTLQKEVEEFQLKEPTKETFKRTHPLWADRIKYYESLRKEAELKKVHGQGKTKFDWEKLAQEYLNEFKKK